MAETEKQKKKRINREAEAEKRLAIKAKVRAEEEKEDAKIAEMRRRNEELRSRKAESDLKEKGSNQLDEHPTMNVYTSLAQQRARHALNAIQQIASDSHSWESNYLSYVKALPATIIMSGLGQAMAMEKAQGHKPKGKENDVSQGHSKIYSHLGNWLLRGWKTSSYSGKNDLLDAIAKGNEQEYIRAQGEAMAYLEWLKKFATAYLVGEEGEG